MSASLRVLILLAMLLGELDAGLAVSIIGAVSATAH